MEETSGVPSLENLAFEMCYNEILGNLILCPEHRPPGKRLPWLSFSHVISTTPFFSSQKARALVRKKLDHYIVGTMSDRIRGKFVTKFYSSISKYQSKLDASKSDGSSSEDSDDEAKNEPEEEECIVDIWPFLDCVLDDTFLQLKTHAAFPGTKPSLKLMSTIAEKSPNLQKLTLDFQLVKSKGGAVMEHLKTIVLSLSSLQQLTSLHFSDLDEKLLKPSALSHLGSSCPGLSHLRIGSCNVHKKVVFALIVGQLYDDLLPDSSEEPDWFKDSALDRLAVPPELLSPLCFTLLELDLSLYDNRGNSNAAFVAAFALRHFRKLQTMDDPVPTCLGIKILHDAEQSSIQSQFGKACLNAAERQAIPSLPALQRNLNATSICLLSLTRLESVNVLSRDLLKAIGSLCPSLKDVTFIKEKHEHTRYSKQVLEPHERIASLMELESILNQWAKVTTIRIDGEVPPDYVQTILKVFGTEVLFLEFRFYSKFYVNDLTSANRLKSLSISCFCELLGSTEDPLLCAENFLPRLKFLESSSCLGVWSYLFEEKSALVRLVLKCCHIGIESSNEGSNVRPSKRFKSITKETNSKQSGWTQIPEMWQLLEVLNLEKCIGLSMPMVPNLVSKLPKLKTIHLPHQVRSTDLHLSYRVTQELSNRIPSVKLLFYSEEEAEDDCSLVEANKLVNNAN